MLLGDNAHEASIAALAERDLARNPGEERVIAALADPRTRVDAGPALPNQDGPGRDGFAAIPLGPQPL